MSEGLTSFYFNGRESSEFPWLFVNEIEIPILPPIEQKMIQVPGRVGAFHMGRKVGPRIDRITITVIGDSRLDLATKKRILANWLDTETPQRFYYSYELDKEYKAILSEETDLKRIVTDGETTLIFVIPDPWASSPTLKTKQVSTGIVVKRTETNQSDWEDQYATRVDVDTISSPGDMKLVKAGTAFEGNITTSWETGTHYQTTETQKPDGTQCLTLGYQVYGGTTLKRHEIQPDDLEKGTITNLKINGNGNLAIANQPSYSLVDSMKNIAGTGWAKYGSVAQSTNYVTVSTDGSIGSGCRLFEKARFPMTLDFYAKTYGASGADCYVHVSNGSQWRDIPLPQLTGSSSYGWYRIRYLSNGQMVVYLNGTQIGSYTMNTSNPSSNRISFGTDPGASATFVMEALYVTYTDLGAPTSSTYNNTGTRVTTYSLDQVKKVKSTMIQWTSIHDSPIADSSKLVTKVETSLDGLTYSTVGNGGTLPGISAGQDLTGKTLYVKITLTSLDPASSSELYDFYFEVIAEPNQYYSSGNRESVNITSPRSAKVIGSTSFSWTANVPAGTSVNAETNVSLDGTNFLGWKSVVKSGDPIPDLAPGTNVESLIFKYRFSLSSTNVNVTPEVLTANYKFSPGFKLSGERISAATDLSSISSQGNPAGNSYITWDASTQDLTSTSSNPVNEATDSSSKIDIEVSLDGGTTWTPVENGKEIPGIRGQMMTGKTIKVRQKLMTSNVVKTPVLHSIYWEVKEQKDTSVTYDGTVPSFPKFKAHFGQHASEFRLIHLQTGKQIYIERAFSAGDMLEIDMATHKLRLNGVFDAAIMRALNVKFSDWFPLIPGLNQFSIIPSEGVVVDIEWMERWK